MAFKPIDPKRDEFRRYLERAGVIEALTKVFVRVIKERPDDPMEYLRNNLGDTLQEADNYTYLQNELEEARVENQRLRSMIEKISPETLAELEVKHNSQDVIENVTSDAANHVKTHNTGENGEHDTNSFNKETLPETHTNNQPTESDQIPSNENPPSVSNTE